MTERAEFERKPGWAERIVRLAFLGTLVSNLLRVYGALGQRENLAVFPESSWLIPYLIGAGAVLGLLNLAAWIVLRTGLKARLAAAWVVVLINITWYWLERFLLWAPGQRGGNIYFVLLVHGLWLGIMLLFTRAKRIWRNDG